MICDAALYDDLLKLVIGNCVADVEDHRVSSDLLGIVCVSERDYRGH